MAFTLSQLCSMIVPKDYRGRAGSTMIRTKNEQHVQWMHFAEGSFASRAIADYRVALI
jgi:hypothetical protein